MIPRPPNTSKDTKSDAMLQMLVVYVPVFRFDFVDLDCFLVCPAVSPSPQASACHCLSSSFGLYVQYRFLVSKQCNEHLRVFFQIGPWSFSGILCGLCHLRGLLRSLSVRPSLAGDLCCGLSIVDLHSAFMLWAPWSFLDFVRRHDGGQFVSQTKLRFFASQRKMQLARCLGFSFFDFDATLGFPGEAPWQPGPEWSIVSYTVESLKDWKTLDDSILCLQETRIGRNNLRSSKSVVSATGRSLYPGALLSGLITEQGSQRIPHGGTAVLGTEGLCKAFRKDQDMTLQYDSLFQSKRCNALWIQVIPIRSKCLCYCFYGQSLASTDKNIHDSNNSLLEEVFEISSQFGNIPIIVTGDFQDLPIHCKSIAHAINFDGWVDPLTSVDSEGTIRILEIAPSLVNFAPPLLPFYSTVSPLQL